VVMAGELEIFNSTFEIKRGMREGAVQNSK
jgi:hypothetical protein